MPAPQMMIQYVTRVMDVTVDGDTAVVVFKSVDQERVSIQLPKVALHRFLAKASDALSPPPAHGA